MHMRNRTLIIVIAALLLSNLILLVAYFYTPKGAKKEEHKQNWSPVEYMSKELQFDTAQKQQFQVLWDSVHYKNKILYDSIRLSREELFKQIGSVPKTDSSVERYAEQIASFEKRITLNNYTHFRKVRSMCDSVQQVKLDTVIVRMAKWGRKPR